MANELLTVRDRVYNELRGRIVRCELPPGTQLAQRRLAAELGVSTMPVVEALRWLERDGLVVSYPKWGARVRSWTLEDFEGAYLMREALEGVCCRLFALRATPAEKATLTELGRQFDNQVLAMSVKQCDEADIALHMHIVRCSRSEVLSQAAEHSCLVNFTIQNTIVLRQNPQEHLGPAGVHDELIAALISGDSTRAEQAGKAHIQQAARGVLETARKEQKHLPSS